MPVSFTVKSKIAGKSRTVKTRGHAKVVSEFVDALEAWVGKVVYAIAKGARGKLNSQQIYMAAIFFQWVVSRTPIDGVYRRSNGSMHYPDNDIIRNDWYLQCGSVTVRSTDFEGAFDSFNDTGAIEKIASHIERSIGKNEIVSDFRVYNTNSRFLQLEYGLYVLSGKGEISIDSEGRKHGVVDGFSIQAPHGMLRLTNAELDLIKTQAKTKALKSSHIAGATQIPSDKRLQEIYRHIDKKKKLKGSDLEALK